MAALKSILSSRVSKWMGHTIATIFLPRSYCQTYSRYPRVGFCLSTKRCTGASSTRHRRFPVSRVAYAADCGSRGFCMIIFGQYTKIIGESIRKQKNHVANFCDGFPVFWPIF